MLSSNMSFPLFLVLNNDQITIANDQDYGLFCHECLLGQHPAKPAKEVSSVKQLRSCLVDKTGLAVVVPGTDTPEDDRV